MAEKEVRRKKIKFLESVNDFSFYQVLRVLNSHGWILGVNYFTPKISATKLFRYAWTFIGIIGYNMFFLWEAHRDRQGAPVVFKDVFVLIFCFGGSSGFYFNTKIFFHQQKITELLKWCERLYDPIPHQTLNRISADVMNDVVRKTQKLTRVLYIGSNLDAFGLIGVSSLPFLLFGKKMFIFPLYNDKKWEFLYFHLIFLFQALYSFYFVRQCAMNIATFSILAKHLSARLRFIARILEVVGTEAWAYKHQKESNACHQVLSYVVDMHSEVIEKIKSVSDFFSTPMILTEVYDVLALTFAGMVIHQYREAAPLALSCILAVVATGLFSFFGQEIIDSAEDVATSIEKVYNFQKKQVNVVKLIVQMSQKRVGITSGGFRMISYAQFLDVRHFFEVLI